VRTLRALGLHRAGRFLTNVLTLFDAVPFRLFACVLTPELQRFLLGTDHHIVDRIMGELTRMIGAAPFAGEFRVKCNGDRYTCRIGFQQGANGTIADLPSTHADENPDPSTASFRRDHGSIALHASVERQSSSEGENK
jgi:hypothetical protein